MTTRNIAWAICALLLFLVTSIHAQEYPASLKERFTKPAPAAHPVPARRAEAPKGFFKPWGKSFAVSSAIYWSASAFDIASSRGLIEQNPLSRGRDGRINVGKALLVDAGVYAPSLLLERKHPRLAFWYRVAAASAKALLGGLHNLREKR